MLPLNTATCLLNKKAQFTGGGRVFGTDKVMAVRANHIVTVSSGRIVTASAAAGMIPARAWHCS
jgi:hypothetical protein